MSSFLQSDLEFNFREIGQFSVVLFDINQLKFAIPTSEEQKDEVRAIPNHAPNNHYLSQFIDNIIECRQWLNAIFSCDEELVITTFRNHLRNLT